MFVAIHKIVHGWHDLPAKGLALFGGDMDKNHHHEKSSSKPLSVQYHQSSGKFCIHLYVGFAALHCIQNIVFSKAWLPKFCIYSWEGTSLLENSMYILKFVSV
jgi:hypothetical protein